MSKTYREWSPDQAYMLPPSPRDWLPEDDLVYFLMETAATLDQDESALGDVRLPEGCKVRLEREDLSRREYRHPFARLRGSDPDRLGTQR